MGYTHDQVVRAIAGVRERNGQAPYDSWTALHGAQQASRMRQQISEEATAAMAVMTALKDLCEYLEDGLVEPAPGMKAEEMPCVIRDGAEAAATMVDGELECVSCARNGEQMGGDWPDA